MKPTPLFYRILLIGFIGALAAYNFGLTTDRSAIITIPVLLVISCFFLTLLFSALKFLLWPVRRFLCLFDGHTYGQRISLGPDSGDYGDERCTKCGAWPPGAD